MRFGMCTSPQRTEELANVGFDYIEWPLRGTVGQMDDEQYAQLREQAKNLSVKPEAWNVMLPSDIKVVGPEADHDALVRYLHTAISRARELGGEVIVFGSGGSRNVPDGWPRDEAVAQFDAACTTAGEIAGQYGITLALEPLNRRECNVLNTVSEGREIVERVSQPTVRLLSDLYHVTENSESFEDTAAAVDVLAHVHVAAPETRQMPLVDRHGDQVRDYLGGLKRAGYQGRISVECSWKDVEEAAQGLAFLRETWDSV